MKYKMYHFPYKNICSLQCLVVSFLNKTAQSFRNMYVCLYISDRYELLWKCHLLDFDFFVGKLCFFNCVLNDVVINNRNKL